MQAQEQATVPNASRTPHFTFSDTLEAQLEELKTNPLLERFHASRAAKAGDPHRPIYHYVNVFANGKQCVAVRVYPGREDSVGVSLRAQGNDAELKSLTAWQMENIHQ